MGKLPFADALIYTEPNATGEAIEQAANLFGAPDASLTLVTAVEPLPEYARFVLPSQYKDWYRAYVNEVQARLDGAAAAMRNNASRTTQVNTLVLTGSPHIEAIRQVLRGKHDLVFKTRESGSGSQALHTLDARLLRKCPCPLWLASPERPLHRIGVAIAPRDELLTPAQAEALVKFNTRLMETAISLAKHQEAELHVVQAWEMPGESWLGTRANHEEFQTYRHQFADKLRGDFEEFLRRFDPSPIKLMSHFTDGPPEDVIPRSLRTNKIDILVVGTVARSGVAGHLLGNTAEKILMDSACSLLVLKPEGWVSPVRLGE